MTYFPTKLSFTWLKGAYLRGEVTPEQVMQEITNRAEQYQEYNIWITAPDMAGMRSYIDKLPKTPSDDYPLWGIPFAIKDNIDLAGVSTTAGCPDYGYIPKENAAVVEKLIAAGAIPVGKTNLDQFATGLVGTRSPYGECCNSFQPELISGGSSSGSAVSVALGMAAFSLGTDTAGSGRVPAALNALFGYKPPLGAWSTKGVVPACASLDCITVFANHLEDIKQINTVARGFDESFCWSREYAKPVGRLPKRIILPKEELKFFGDYSDVFRTKWEKAVERIKSMGITVEYLDCTMFGKAAALLYDGPLVAERWKDLGDFIESHSGKIFPVTEEILRSGNKPEYTAASLYDAMHQLAEFKCAASRILKDSVLVMPTCGGTFTREQVRMDPIAANSMMGLYTNHCNLLDLCGAAVPTETSCKKMPFGITIFGLSHMEGMVLETADAFLNQETMEIAVCGFHKKGYPLESQLMELGASYTGPSKTADCYQLYRLDTNPVKPGMVRDESGACINVDIYEIPVKQFGKFMRQVPEPLTIGTITLHDGRKVKGFLCESYAAEAGVDITSRKSF